MSFLRRLHATWRRDPAALAVPSALFLFALFAYTRALGWGLPSGDETWAADAIKPTAPLAVAWQQFGAHGFNSGWFWFKYPPLHAFLLSAVYAPYLAWLWASGGLHGFQPDYPFGMTDPVASLSVLAMLGKATSAVMGAGCVVLAYACTERSLGRASGVGAALFTALAYPMVFYAQTTNVEVPYLFWMMLALLAAVRLVEGAGGLAWWALLGAGAALSLSSKELAAGFFVGLPPVLLAVAWRQGRPASWWLRGGAAAAATFVVLLALANNAFWNPLGFARRLGFLTQTLPREIALQYAPYYFPIELGGSRGWTVEAAQAAKAAQRLLASLGWPVALLAAAGFAGALRRRPAWALLLLAAAAAYYLVSVRAMLSLSLRYLLPMTVTCCLAAGAAFGSLWATGRAQGARRLAALAALGWAFAYGWDTNRMMTGDARMEAARWLAARGAASVEIYQNRTYLPHFPATMRVNEVPYEQRDAASFAQRAPDLVVLSSSGLSGVDVRYKQDWQEDDGGEDGYSPAQQSAGGQVMNFSRDANRDFLARLTSGALGYRVALRIRATPWIERPLIQSLNPEITIYERVPAPAAQAPGNAPT